MNLYTIGIIEATDPTGEEFGEGRLLELPRANRLLTPSSIMKRTTEAVRIFAAGEQADDITMVIVECCG